jgi:hypothetical protein
MAGTTQLLCLAKALNNQNEKDYIRLFAYLFVVGRGS